MSRRRLRAVPDIEAVTRAVSDDDRRWFAANPDEHERVRPAADGEYVGDVPELPPLPPEWTATLMAHVVQLAPGLRVRSYYLAIGPASDDGAAA